jgi:tRNA uridine 5-carboxymethylaminomethyl modification enzyme
VAALKNAEALKIPADFDFEMIQGLSNELKSKLLKTGPANLAQAGRVEGMTPAALTLILAKLRQERRVRSA